MLLPRPGDIYFDKANHVNVRIVKSDEQTVTYERENRPGYFSVSTERFEENYEFLRSE